MCLNRYKNLIRGAFALAVSYLEVTTVTPDTRDLLKDIIATYLRENEVGFDFDAPQNKDLVIKIVTAGESVRFDNESMDSALERLSRGIKLNLTTVKEAR